MESSHESSRKTEISNPETLHELLARLNEFDTINPVTRSEHVTVEDVAEALNLDPDFVAKELEAIHEEHREARLIGVLRELEEPLYRVERTGHADIDPLTSPLFKLRSVQILADKNRTKATMPRRKVELDRSERLSQWIGHAMLYLLIGILALFLIKAAIATVFVR